MIPLDTFLYTIIIFVDITAKPRMNLTVAMGTNVILTCNGTGADNLKYQWMRMGKKTIPSRARGVNSNILLTYHLRIMENAIALHLVAVSM